MGIGTIRFALNRPTSEEIRELVARELAWITDTERREAFERLLCEPYQQTRVWDWANSDEQVSVWIFAVSADGRIGFAYSRAGYQDTRTPGALSS